jgi:CheY-like chemotaxis protein
MIPHTLPTPETRNRAKLEIPGQASPHEGTLRKILIADDEHVIADTLAIILRASGFDTFAVYDGANAVEKARAWKPDLLLSDVMMPGMSGIEAAIEICKLIPECRVLLFSGYAESADLLHDSRVQGHKFQILQKPLHPSELIARLRGV